MYMMIYSHVMLNRAKELRAAYPEKKVRVTHTISSDDLEEMDFYSLKGSTLVERT